MALVAPETDRRVNGFLRASGVLTLVLIPLGAVLVAYYAPTLPDCHDFLDAPAAPANCQSSPIAQKIFYIHVPIAFAAYVAFAALAIASYRHLAHEDDASDAFARGAAEVGVLFAGLTLFTGILWGHLEWGFGYWDNSDWKLVLTLLLFLVYVGYLVLRAQVADPRRRARIAAVYALLGVVTVPLSYIAQRLWQSRHPTVFAPPAGQGGITTAGIEETFAVNLFAFIALAVFLMLARFRLELARRGATRGGA